MFKKIQNTKFNVKNRFVLVALGLMLYVLCLGVSRSVWAAQATMYLSVSSGNFPVGSTFNVNIIENSGSTSVNAVRANIVYPADKLEIVDITDSSAFNLPISTSSGGGNARIERASYPSAVSGIQTVATIQFKVKSAGSIPVGFGDGSVLLSSGVDILNGATLGAIYSGYVPVSPNSSPAPKKTPPSRPTPPPLVAPKTLSQKAKFPKSASDFNQSGYVDIYDLMLLLRNYQRNTKYDINKDKIVNTIDLSILLSNYGK